ncbi:MAG: hypothetical protein MJ239_05630 [Bacilli bacterium]|nr:hypothetical protein [Bacilli bacterium]
MKKLNPNVKNVIILAIIGVIGALVCLPFAFIEIGGSKWPGLSLGVVLGTAIEIVCFLLLIEGASLLTATTKKGALISLAFNLLRIVLFVGGLVLGAFCTFVWKGNWLNIFAIAASYFPMIVLLVVNKIAEIKETK